MGNNLSFQKMVQEDKVQSVKLALFNERLSYPMSLLYVLQTLRNRRLGQDQLPLKDITTLTIHGVNNNPLFDSKPWVMFMHLLPKLKQINVIFILQGKSFTETFGHNYTFYLKRCSDCEDKNRVITYSVKQMLYHMFFSSHQYTILDVSVVYGNTEEMSATDEI